MGEERVLQILVTLSLGLFHRHAIFKAEDRCFVTFPADQLTVPLLPYVLGYTSSPEQANGVWCKADSGPLAFHFSL